MPKQAPSLHNHATASNFPQYTFSQSSTLVSNPTDQRVPRTHSFISPEPKEKKLVPRVKLPLTQINSKLNWGLDPFGEVAAAQNRSSFIHSSPLLKINAAKRAIKVQGERGDLSLIETKNELPLIEKQRRKQAAKITQYLKPYYNSARNSKSLQQSQHPSQDYISSEQSSILQKPQPSISPPRSTVKPKLSSKLHSKKMGERFAQKKHSLQEMPRSQSQMDSRIRVFKGEHRSESSEHVGSMNIQVPFSLPIDEMYNGESESAEEHRSDKRSLPVQAYQLQQAPSQELKKAVKGDFKMTVAMDKGEKKAQIKIQKNLPSSIKIKSNNNLRKTKNGHKAGSLTPSPPPHARNSKLSFTNIRNNFDYNAPTPSKISSNLQSQDSHFTSIGPLTRPISKLEQKSEHIQESPSKINETWDGPEIKGELFDIDHESKEELLKYINNFNFKQLVSPTAKNIYRTPPPHLRSKMSHKDKKFRSKAIVSEKPQPRDNVLTSHSMQTLPSQGHNISQSKPIGQPRSGRDSNSGSLYVNGVVQPYFKNNNGAGSIVLEPSKSQFYLKFQSYFESLRQFKNLKQAHHQVNSITPRKLHGGFPRGSSSQTFRTSTTITHFRGSPSSSTNFSRVNKKSGAITINKSFSHLNETNTSVTSHQIGEVSPYLESGSNIASGLSLKQKVRQTKPTEAKPKTELELKTEELKDLKEETRSLKKQMTLKARELVKSELGIFNLEQNNSFSAFLAGCLASTAQKKIKLHSDQDATTAQNLLELIYPEELQQSKKVKAGQKPKVPRLQKLERLRQAPSKLENKPSSREQKIKTNFFDLLSEKLLIPVPPIVYTRLSNIPCFLQVKQPSAHNKRAVIVLSSCESSTGFVIKYGGQPISLAEEINRLYFDSQRNELILKRGQKFEEQLQQDNEIRRSLIVRIKGGALFPRSRILVSIRPQKKRKNQQLFEGTALDYFGSSPIGNIMVQFREKRYMLNYSTLSFPRESFYQELQEAKISDFTSNLLSPKWLKMIKFLENSVVITRAYICAMEQTTVLKPELRFFQNKFIGKDFNLYVNSQYDEEELAQEVMAITQRAMQDGGANEIIGEQNFAISNRQKSEPVANQLTQGDIESEMSARHTNLCFETSNEYIDVSGADSHIHVQNDDDDSDEDDDDDDQEELLEPFIKNPEDIDFSSQVYNEDDVQPYVSQSWGGGKIFKRFEDIKKVEKNGVSRRYAEISNSSSLQVRSSSQQFKKKEIRLKLPLSPSSAANQLSPTQVKIQNEFSTILKQDEQMLEELALNALKNKVDSPQKFTESGAMKSLRLTHSEFQESRLQSEEDEEELGETFEIESEKPEFNEKENRPALPLKLTDAHGMNYFPSNSNFTNNIFPGTNRSQFTVIALQTPKCIPVEASKEQEGKRNSIKGKSTVRDFHRNKTQLPQNPFSQFNFFYRYTSNAPRFARSKKAEKPDQPIQIHSALLPNPPSAQISPLKKRPSQSNQRVLCTKKIEFMKIIAIKQKVSSGTKILFFSEELTSRQSSIAEIKIDENMETIVTDQVNAFKSPTADTKPSFDLERSVLVVDQDWVDEKKLEGYKGVEDVERKVEKFIGLVYSLGFLKNKKVASPLPKKRRLLSQG